MKRPHPSDFTEEPEEAEEMRERGLQPGEHVSKDRADYRKGSPFRRCELCEYYSHKHCEIVTGDIDPYMVCKFFEMPD